AGFRKIGRRADITAQPWLWLGWVWRYNLFVISDTAANLHKISYAIAPFLPATDYRLPTTILFRSPG
ncbi:MAG: hypothetical protein SVV80_10405, partial [Planctomycetota bacterium]|nr:hypothetical protein [Planctomycetota bacterium]